MAAQTPAYSGFVHAGGGTGLALIQLGAIIPGLLPTLALLAVFLLPLVALALIAAVLAAPPAGAWMLLARRRRRRRAGPGDRSG